MAGMDAKFLLQLQQLFVLVGVGADIIAVFGQMARLIHATFLFSIIGSSFICSLFPLSPPLSSRGREREGLSFGRQLPLHDVVIHHIAVADIGDR